MKLTPWIEYQQKLPKKRNGTGVILWDKKGRVLLLKPSYKDHWTIPGGTVDESESPRQAAKRELYEEAGLDIEIKQLLAVSYNKADGEYDENIQWIFYGGVLSTSQIKKIRVDTEEIEDFLLADMTEVRELMKMDFSRKLNLYKKAVKTGLAYYLENWEEC